MSLQSVPRSKVFWGAKCVPPAYDSHYYGLKAWFGYPTFLLLRSKTKSVTVNYVRTYFECNNFQA